MARLGPRFLVAGILVSALAGACVSARSISFGDPKASATPGGPSLASTISSLAMARGEEERLSEFLRGADGQPPTQGVIWLSSDPRVVTVHATSGLARAMELGQATLTATLQGDQNASARIQIKVNPAVAVATISIAPASASLLPGERITFSAEVRMGDGTLNANVYWSSSDDTLASIDQTSGEAIARRPGRVTVRAAYVPSPQFLANATVSIRQPDEVALPDR